MSRVTASRIMCFPLCYNMMVPLHLTGSTKYQPLCWPSTLCFTNHTGIQLPDLIMGAQTLSGIVEWLRDIHQQVAPAEAPTKPNPYQPADHIWVSTPSLERTSKLMPRWIGPSRVIKVPNPYQLSYSTNRGSQMIRIHHTKPALLDLLTKSPAPED